MLCVTSLNLGYLIGIFTHLRLCLADAIHNFKWVKIIQIWQNGDCWLMSSTCSEAGIWCANKQSHKRSHQFDPINCHGNETWLEFHAWFHLIRSKNCLGVGSMWPLTNNNWVWLTAEACLIPWPPVPIIYIFSCYISTLNISFWKC